MNAAAQLIDLATAIADGASIDWNAASLSAVSVEERELIAQLHALERVASAHSSLPAAATFVRSWPLDSVDDVGETWGSLEILRKIGSGAHADVYLARDPKLDRSVALKLLRSREQGVDASSVIEEARLLARVRHPNVVTVYGAERIDGRTGMWMEYIDGRTLEEELRASGPLSADELVHVGLAVSEALAAVHAAGLVHRDVKAQNVLREPGGRVLLSDFGTGRETTSTVYELAGTPLYLAPEVLDGDPASARSDVYSVGVLLFHLATGTFPVVGRSIGDLRDAHRLREPSDVKSALSNLPRRLVASIERALSPDSTARFDGAEAFARALAEPNVSRRRGTVVVGSITLAAIAIALIGVGWKWRATPAPPIPARPRDLVLVAAFDNRTGAPTLDGIVEAAIARGLTNSEMLSSVPQERIDETLRLMTKPPDTPLQPDIAREVCLRDGGIRAFVGGRIDRSGFGYDITVSLFDPVDARAVSTVEQRVPDDGALPSAVRQLARDVEAEAAESIGAIHSTERIEKVTTPSLKAARLFSGALRTFNLNRFPEAEGKFNAALAADPHFASADIWLAWTRLNLRKPADDYLAPAQRAVDLAQSVSLHEREWIAGSYYMMTGQDERAIGEYEALLRRYPDDTWAFYNLRRLYGDNGVTRDSLDLEARVADARPDDFLVQWETAKSFLQSEGLEAARTRVERARRVMPPANLSADGTTIQAVIWTLLFPAQEFWSEGRAADSARVLDDVSRRPEFALERSRSLTMLGEMRLALGQVHLAESVFSRISDPRQRGICSAEIALVQGDMAAVAARLRENSPNDLAVPSLLIRAGRLEEAAAFLRTVPPAISRPQGNNAIWSTNELQEARGNRTTIERALEGGTPWTQTGISLRTFLYSETLARAAASVGNRAAAITVLEETAPAGTRDLGQHGYFWMRDQKLLADLYRQDGQVDKARAIERDLLARLAVADSDFPLLVELKQRPGL